MFLNARNSYKRASLGAKTTLNDATRHANIFSQQRGGRKQRTAYYQGVSAQYPRLSTLKKTCHRKPTSLKKTCYRKPTYRYYPQYILLMFPNEAVNTDCSWQAERRGTEPPATNNSQWAFLHCIQRFLASLLPQVLQGGSAGRPKGSEKEKKKKRKKKQQEGNNEETDARKQK